MDTQAILKLSKELNEAQEVRDALIKARESVNSDSKPKIVLTIDDKTFPISSIEVCTVIEKTIDMQNKVIDKIRQSIQKELFPSIARPAQYAS